MLIPDTLLCCIQFDMGIVCFPPISMARVWGKRTWSHCTPEARAEHCRKMSEKRLNFSKTKKKKASKVASKAMKNYWKNITPEQKEFHTKAIGEGMHRAWDEANKDPNHIFHHKRSSKEIDLIKDVPRINTYSGVITESQMDEISA